jgi:hypothetical protein
MSVRSGIFAGLAALTLATATLTTASLAASSTTPAAAESARPAASSACGSPCTTISVSAFGSGYAMEVAGSAAVGAGIYLVAAANNENEDFTLNYEGTVNTFYDDGIFNSVVGTTWPNDDVYEYEYAPGGKDSNLCVGETSLGNPLTLQACGVSAVTCWVALSNDDIGGYEPLMIGTDTVVNTPYVMTANSTYSDVYTSEMTLYQGTFSPNQMMRDLNGVL